MLHILWIIIRFLLILIGSILGLILLILLTVLLCPFRYEIVADKETDAWKEIRARVGVSWLMRGIQVKVAYMAGNLDKEVYLFGVPLLKTLNKIKNLKKKKAKQRIQKSKLESENTVQKIETKPISVPEKSEEIQQASETIDQVSAPVLGMDESGLQQSSELQQSEIETSQVSETAESEPISIPEKAPQGTVEITSKPLDKEIPNQEKSSEEKKSTEENDKESNEKKNKENKAEEKTAKAKEKKAKEKKTKEKKTKEKKSKEKKPAVQPAESIIPEETKVKVPLEDRIRKFTDKIQSTFQNLSEKKARLDKELNWWKGFLGHEKFKAALSLVLKSVFRILKHVLPNKMKGSVTFGSDDPATTGKVLAIMGATMPIHQNQIEINPLFDGSKVIEGSVTLKGRIYVIVIVVTGLQLLLSKNIRFVIKQWKKKKEG